MRLACLLCSLALAVAGCDVLPDGAVKISFDFDAGTNGWRSDVSDYPEGSLDTLEFEAGARDLPSELGDGRGYYLKTMNRADDAFMFLTRRLTAADGISPGESYQLTYVLRVGSNLPSGCAGIGGAPESSYFKAGAATIEPAPLLDDAQQYVGLTVDKGNQSTGGPAASLVGGDGDVTNGDTTCGDDVPYVALDFTHTHTTDVVADNTGNLWLLVGTDSGYEGLTALYFLSIEVTLTPAGP